MAKNLVKRFSKLAAAGMTYTALSACGGGGFDMPDLRPDSVRGSFDSASTQPPSHDPAIAHALMQAGAYDNSQGVNGGAIDDAVAQALAAEQAAPQYSVLEDPNMDIMRVAYHGDQPVHSILLDAENLNLYYIDRQGSALRYPIAMGRTGAEMPDVEYYIDRKNDWPNWYPTASMRDSNPNLPSVVPGGADNPLGAAALYLSDANGATLYRIHGTNAPESIRTNASSGCIRLFNHHITDLYQRTPDPATTRMNVQIADPADLRAFGYMPSQRPTSYAAARPGG